jgi:hypothetical protein
VYQVAGFWEGFRVPDLKHPAGLLNATEKLGRTERQVNVVAAGITGLGPHGQSGTGASAPSVLTLWSNSHEFIL